MLPASIEPSAEIGDLADVDVVVLAVPTQATRAAMAALAPMLASAQPVLSAAKGIERSTGSLVADVIAGIYALGPVAGAVRAGLCE